MPETISELVWYMFGSLGAYFLWSIKKELTGLRSDIKEERDARGLIEQRLAAVEARCQAQHSN